MKQFAHAFFMQRVFTLARLAIIGMFATLVMLYAGSSTAWAADNSVEAGGFTLAFTDADATSTPVINTDYSYDDTTLTITTDTPITIRMADGVTSTTNIIVLTGGDAFSPEVTLSGVTISASSGAAITISENSTATIHLAENTTNTVTGANGYAGIATTGATLTIAALDETGKLIATGQGSWNSDGGAGIGGNSGAASGNLTITGGTVSATGGYYGAGIGGGKSGAGTGEDGYITINGNADVTANGGERGAGIGGGNGSAGTGDGGSITISGDAKVTANGGVGSAGIGGGYNGSGYSTIVGTGIGGKIVIDGGTVTAIGGSDMTSGGAGIGGGFLSAGTGTSGSIMIRGGTVTATGGNYSAGIGGGGGAMAGITAASGAGAGTGTDGTITISGGVVTATGNAGGAGIGGGSNGGTALAAGTFTTGENGTAFIVASSVQDISNQTNWSGVIITSSTGAIYGGDGSYTLTTDANIPSDYTFTVENGQSLIVNTGVRFTVAENASFAVAGGDTYTAETVPSGRYTGVDGVKVGDFLLAVTNDPTATLSAGDYSYSDTKTTLTITTDTPITIRMASGVTSTTNLIVLTGDDVDKTSYITLNDVNIATSSGAPITITSGTIANITLVGDNSAESGSSRAGIVTTDATLNIDGTGSLCATGGGSSAGIGGNYAGSGIGGAGGTVTISGDVTVTATGSSGGAGIGGGYGGSAGGAGGTVTISGNATVAATGSGGGAGIGGGGGWDADGGSITISENATVEATGGSNGAGIGGGDKGAGGTINITGGTVYAYGGTNAAGIGGGSDGGSGTFTTGTAGDAFIVASSIQDESRKDTWSGAIVTLDGGAIYGDRYTLNADATIPNGYTLTLESGKSFTVPSGIVFTVAQGGAFETVENSMVYTNQIIPVGTYPMAITDDSTQGDTTTSDTTSTTTVTTWYNVSLSTSGGGTIAPELSGFSIITMKEGTSYTFSITPNSGYVISAVYVDGTNIGVVTSYTIDSIHANRSIHVDFVSTSTTSATETESDETEEIDKAGAAEDEADTTTEAEDTTDAKDTTEETIEEDTMAEDIEKTEGEEAPETASSSSSAVPLVVSIVAGVTALGGAGYWLLKGKFAFGSED